MGDNATPLTEVQRNQLMLLNVACEQAINAIVDNNINIALDIMHAAQSMVKDMLEQDSNNHQ